LDPPWSDPEQTESVLYSPPWKTFMKLNPWIAALVLSYSLPAFAQSPGGGPAPRTAADVAARFKAADTDSDGTLDRTEAATMPGLAAKFDVVDKDKDGTIDMKEIEAYHSEMTKSGGDRIERRFKASDADKDGTIDRKEAASWPGLAKHFDVVDTDHDGTVDLNEVRAAMGRRPSRTLQTPAPVPAPGPAK
jgi:Ca2+-binding EF-hand superfamily protein